MYINVTAKKGGSINNENEQHDILQRKAQQLALEEEMEKLRRRQSAGWHDEITLGFTESGQTKTIDVFNENMFTQLQNMGFNQYTIKQAFKYSDKDVCNDNLLPLIEWIESHKISKEEIENYRIDAICKQLSNINIKCNRFEALHVNTSIFIHIEIQITYK